MEKYKIVEYYTDNIYTTYPTGEVICIVEGDKKTAELVCDGLRAEQYLDWLRFRNLPIDTDELYEGYLYTSEKVGDN